MSAVPRSWSCSTLLAGMKAVSGQSGFLQSRSDADLEKELKVPRNQIRFAFLEFAGWNNDWLSKPRSMWMVMGMAFSLFKDFFERDSL